MNRGATGAQGPIGLTGATGSQGPTGITGAVGITFRRAWTNITTYAVNDTVTLGGSSWLSVTSANLGNNPTTDTGANWTVLAEAGATGATGATGAGLTSGMWVLVPTNAVAPAGCTFLGTTTMAYKYQVLVHNKPTTKTATKTLDLYEKD